MFNLKVMARFRFEPVVSVIERVQDRQSHGSGLRHSPSLHTQRKECGMMRIYRSNPSAGKEGWNTDMGGMVGTTV